MGRRLPVGPCPVLCLSAVSLHSLRGQWRSLCVCPVPQLPFQRSAVAGGCCRLASLLGAAALYAFPISRSF